MNQGKIWLVVKPTVGLPLFLGGVTVIALCVHAAILTKTEWYPAYYSGKPKAKVAEIAPATPNMATTQGMATVVAAATTTDMAAPAVKGSPPKK